jgi:hemolysin activation/secretion protein
MKKQLAAFALLSPLLAFAQGQLVSAPALPAASAPAPAASSPAPAAAPVQPARPAAPAPTFDVYSFAVEGNTVLPAAVVERVLMPFMGPAKRFEDIEQARATLEKAYQDSGFLSVLVSLPNQRVDSGEVRLEVTQANIDKLRITGAEYHLPSKLRAKLPALTPGQVPNFTQVQRELAAVQTADLQLTPLINASESGQGIDVDLKVEDKAPVSGAFEANTGQSYNTRRGRVMVQALYNNLFQLGHTLGVSWMYAPYRPADGNTLSILYGLPLSGRDTVLASFTRSDSDTPSQVSGSGPTSTVTKGEFLGARWVHRMDAFNWPARHGVYVGLDYKNNRDFNAYSDGVLTRKAPLRYPLLSLGYNLNLIPAAGSTTVLNTGIKGSARALSDRVVDCDGVQKDQFSCKRAGSGPDFLAWQAGINHSQPVFGSWRVNFNADVQLASGALPGGEQFSLGGLGTVRGYYDFEQSGDEGWTTRTELVTPTLVQLWGQRLTAQGFYDRGFIRYLNPQSTQLGRIHMGSVGLGLRTAGDSGLQIGLDVARVLFDTQRVTDNGSRQYASGSKADRSVRVDLGIKQAF